MKNYILLFGACFFLGKATQAQWSGGTNPTTLDDVGIGTTTLTSKLSISSAWSTISGQGINDPCTYKGKPALRINWTAPSNMIYCPNGTTGSVPNIMEVFKSFQYIGTFPILILDDYGNLGIGLQSPTSKLHVNGNSIIESNVTTDLSRFENKSTNAQTSSSIINARFSNPQTNNPMLLSLFGNNSSSAANRFVVKNDGQVIVGNYNTSSGYKLFVQEGILTDKVTIGQVSSTPSDYRLFVQDGILTEKLKVAVHTTSDWSDYVFAKNYDLISLDKIEKYINHHNHLPNIPSAEDVVNNGIDVAKMDAKLLEKIEELTLYMIQLNKENMKLKERIEKLEK